MFNKITNKIFETSSAAVVESKIVLLATILKVELASERGKKDGLSKK